MQTLHSHHYMNKVVAINLEIAIIKRNFSSSTNGAEKTFNNHQFEKYIQLFYTTYCKFVSIKCGIFLNNSTINFVFSWGIVCIKLYDVLRNGWTQNLIEQYVHSGLSRLLMFYSCILMRLTWTQLKHVMKMSWKTHIYVVHRTICRIRTFLVHRLLQNYAK